VEEQEKKEKVMHIITLCEGDYYAMLRFIHTASAQHYPYISQDGKGVRIGLSARVMWPIDWVFPDDEYQEVLNTLAPFYTGNYLQKHLPLLRKLMQLKEITTPATANRKIWRQGVSVLPVGYKNDPKDGLGREML